LMVFENTVFRKTVGANKVDVTWKGMEKAA
jgi:hypothetical protein